VTAVVLAVVLAGCLWLALRPPRWLLPDRHARRFGIGMALALVAGFVLVSRLGLRGVDLADAGMMSYLLFAPPVVVLAGSATAAAVGRSFRRAVGLRLGHRAGWAAGDRRLAGRGAALVPAGRRAAPGADGGVGMGANLGDAIWWTLVVLVLWALPMGVPGAAAGSARARRQRAREHADLAPTA
jgi:hypothetical protein